MTIYIYIIYMYYIYIIYIQIFSSVLLLRVSLSAEDAKNVSWHWLFPLRGWGSLTVIFLGKFVYIFIYIYAYIYMYTCMYNKCDCPPADPFPFGTPATI